MKKEIVLLLGILLLVSACDNPDSVPNPTPGNNQNNDNEETCNNQCNSEGNYCTGNSIYSCIKDEDGCLKSTLVKSCLDSEECSSATCKEKPTYKLSEKFSFGDYPEPFIVDNKFNDYILVMGENGLLGEVIAGADFQSGIFDFVSEQFPSPFVTRELSSIANKNAVLLGNPCTNKFIAEVKGIAYKSDSCNSFLKEGETVLELYDNLDGEHAVLLIMAKSDSDYKSAGIFLKRWTQHKAEFKGNRIVIS